jgi:hypothetical protein
MDPVLQSNIDPAPDQLTADALGRTVTALKASWPSCDDAKMTCRRCAIRTMFADRRRRTMRLGEIKAARIRDRSRASGRGHRPINIGRPMVQDFRGRAGLRKTGVPLFRLAL